MRRRRSSAGRLNSTKPPKYFLDIANLISNLYPNAKKIVEVGVGRSPYTVIRLQSLLPGAEIIVTDVDRRVVRELARWNLNSVLDDISQPNLEIYENADLIYSIRPPFELIPNLEALAEKTGADVLIIPLSEDAYLSNLSKKWKVIQRNGLTAYLLKNLKNLFNHREALY